MTVNSEKITYLYDANDNRMYKQVDTTLEEYYLKDLGVLNMKTGNWSYYLSGTERFLRIEPDSVHQPKYNASIDSVSISNGERFYYETDHLGNTRIVFTPRDVYFKYIHFASDFYPYGKILREYVSVPEKYQLTGKQRDEETELDYFGARFFDSDIARFEAIDALQSKYPGFSTYAYCLGNPVKFTDPTGMAVEDWVKRANGSVYWDKNANDQASTKARETYLGKTLEFTFVSYIDKKLWDGPLGDIPTGIKLTSTITLNTEENSDGNITNISASYSVKPGSTPRGTPRTFYPGAGGSNNQRTAQKTRDGNGVVQQFRLAFEQHASVSPIEEFGMKQMGYKIVDVAQKLNLVYNKKNLWIGSYTDIFPSATLTLNGYNVMQYNQPSFVGTHTAPTTWDYLPPFFKQDFSYYPSKFYRR